MFSLKITRKNISEFNVYINFFLDIFKNSYNLCHIDKVVINIFKINILHQHLPVKNWAISSLEHSNGNPLNLTQPSSFEL